MQNLNSLINFIKSYNFPENGKINNFISSNNKSNNY